MRNVDRDGEEEQNKVLFRPQSSQDVSSAPEYD